jgi:import inner membrane translocase subunit TIM8
MEELNTLIQGLDSKDKMTLQTFLQQEQKRQTFNSEVHVIASKCFDKCLPGAPTTSLSSAENRIFIVLLKYSLVCIETCVNRFFESANFFVNKFNR